MAVIYCAATSRTKALQIQCYTSFDVRSHLSTLFAADCYVQKASISSFTLEWKPEYDGGRIRVSRHRAERLLKCCVMHRHTGPASSIMVWVHWIGFLVCIADLSPIENEWSILAQQLVRDTPPAATPDQRW
ncbi:hypothetical protein TNCV_4707262 [Trichonephila clavipes]|nr:hypothetical protein TNCV_4707262 [Trichonephila clavipes]